MLLINPSSEPEAIAFTMAQLEERHLKSNNPIYPMFAFRHCFQRGVEPPQWVMQYVAISFHDYLLNCGTKDVDECMQLRVGKGKTPPIKLFLLEERDETIMWDMFRLVEHIGISVENAAHMTKAKLEAADWNKTLIEMTELTEGSILDMYRKTYRKQFREMLASEPSHAEYFTKEKQKSFLATFPAYSLPVD